MTCAASFLAQPLSFHFVLQVVGHHYHGGLGHGKFIQLGLLDDSSKLLLLLGTDLLQTLLLHLELLDPELVLARVVSLHLL